MKITVWIGHYQFLSQLSPHRVEYRNFKTYAAVENWWPEFLGNNPGSRILGIHPYVEIKG
jgi:hypothetical protein